MYNHILIPIDGSERAIRALEHGIALAKRAGGEVKLTVLHVNPIAMLNEMPIGVDVVAAIEADGRHVMDPAVERLNAAKVPFETRIEQGDAGRLICEIAEQESCDLIIMSSRGAGFVSELFLGSVSHSVVQHAHIPVLIVK